MANVLKSVDFTNENNIYPVGLRYTLVNGALANTAITLSGIMPDDRLIFVVAFISGVPSDLTEEASIVAANQIKLATTDTSTGKLWVCWYDMA